MLLLRFGNLRAHTSKSRTVAYHWCDGSFISKMPYNRDISITSSHSMMQPHDLMPSICLGSYGLMAVLGV